MRVEGAYDSQAPPIQVGREASKMPQSARRLGRVDTETKPAGGDESAEARKASTEYLDVSKTEAVGPVDSQERIKAMASANIERLADELKEFVRKLNEINRVFDNRIEFEFSEDYDTTVIRIVSKDTEEVLKEIPAVKLLEAMDQIVESLGIVLDQEA